MAINAVICKKGYENRMPSQTIKKSQKSIGCYVVLGQVPLKRMPVKQEIQKSVTAWSRVAKSTLIQSLNFP